MNTLAVRNLDYMRTDETMSSSEPVMKWGRIGKLTNFSYSFQYGKAYLLESTANGGGWSLSWIIGGLIEQTNGTIERDGFEYARVERRKDAWCIRHETSPKNLFWEPSVISQIRHGLKLANNQFLQSEEELINRIGLSPERYKRPLRQLSHEAWRASCAIGMAFGKSIYCFPYMSPDYLEHYPDFKGIINLLKESSALVLLPTKATLDINGWFDEIVQLPI